MNGFQIIMADQEDPELHPLLMDYIKTTATYKTIVPENDFKTSRTDFLPLRM